MASKPIQNNTKRWHEDTGPRRKNDISRTTDVFGYEFFGSLRPSRPAKNEWTPDKFIFERFGKACCTSGLRDETVVPCSRNVSDMV